MKETLDCPFDFTSRCTMGNCDCKPKQETLEEAANNYVRNESDATLKLISKYSFKDGVKWQAERMYSEEEVYIIASNLFYNMANAEKGLIHKYETFEKWFEQFKKK
jgi:Icc-related predicted phosphoesterase